MVVKHLHIEVAVDVQLSVVGDGVTQIGTVVQRRSTHPVIGGIVRGVRGYPVEYGQLIDGHLIRRRKGLAIVQGTSEVLDALPYRILPGVVTVRIEVLVDRQVAQRLFYLRLRARLEIHVEVAGEVPAQGEATIPQELGIEGNRQSGASEFGHVTFLQFVIETGYLGIEGHTLRQPVQGEGLGKIHPFRLALRLLERFPRLINGRIAVVQRASPLVFLLIDGRLARGEAMRMTIGEGEVGRVVRHGVPLGLDAEAHVRQREIGAGSLGYRDVLDRVALMTGRHLQGVVQFHVSIQRIIFRSGFLLGHRVIKRCRHLHLVREELAQLHAGRQRVSLIVVLGTGRYPIFQSAEAFGNDLSREVDRSHVGELYVQRSRGGPTTAVHHIHQTQLVDPYFA